MLASALLSACIFDEVNIAISLHQFAILTLVLTTGNLLRQPLILQALQATANAACLALVTEARIHIFRREGVRQSAIAQPRLLFVAHVRRLCRSQVIVVLFEDSLTVVLLERQLRVGNQNGQANVPLVNLEVGATLPASVAVLNHFRPMS